MSERYTGTIREMKVEVKIDDLIQKYVEVRDRKDALKEKHAKELEPYEEALSMVESALRDKMQELGVNSFKCEHGTAYTKELKSVGVVDWKEVLDYVKKNERWDLLTRKITTSALQEGEYVPGTEVSKVLKVNVRRGK